MMDANTKLGCVSMGMNVWVSDDCEQIGDCVREAEQGHILVFKRFLEDTDLAPVNTFFPAGPTYLII